MITTVRITPDGIVLRELRSDTGDEMSKKTIRPERIMLELPTGEVISIGEVVQHLEQEYGPWPAERTAKQ